MRVSPRSSREELAGLHEEAVRVRLTAPPVEGLGNRALVRLIARAVGVPRKDVEVVSGERSRLKTIRIRGLDAGEVASRLSRAVGP